MTGKTPPKIEFPCNYPIKVLGDAREDFVDRVFEIMQIHAPEIERSRVTMRDSRNGTFISVQIVIRATGVDQLHNIHQSLLRYEAVKMVI